MDTLKTLSPLDGRYEKEAQSLSSIFSEKGLINQRIFVELKYFQSLSESRITHLRKFLANENKLLSTLINLSNQDISLIKKIEEKGHGRIKATNHDVKAVEYFLKEKLKPTSLKDCLEWIHFGLTSEDINNVSYALMLSDAITTIFLPCFENIIKSINNFARKSNNVPMLARTHGQPASPTTIGKQFAVYSDRLQKQVEQLKKFKISVKCNGATGNYNAHIVAYPEVNWKKFTDNFVMELNRNRKIKLVPNHFTTQIEPHDTYAELFDLFRRINIILIGFNQDIWRYISDDWLTQKIIGGEIGSSTMPHKINPIDFEKSEGNLGLANALFNYFSNKLPISRLQRDLSDSTVERNFGVALGYSIVAYKSVIKGLSKIVVNKDKIKDDLENHPEVITEGAQTILRKEGVKLPYEQLKKLTRGKKVTLEDIHHFIDTLNISEQLKIELKKITPSNYIGNSDKF